VEEVEGQKLLDFKEPMKDREGGLVGANDGGRSSRPLHIEVNSKYNLRLSVVLSVVLVNIYLRLAQA
jgi:hypothetical protein